MLPDSRNNSVIVDDRALAEWRGIWYSFHAEFSLLVEMLCQRELIESQMEQSVRNLSRCRQAERAGVRIKAQQGQDDGESRRAWFTTAGPQGHAMSPDWIRRNAPFPASCSSSVVA